MMSWNHIGALRTCIFFMSLLLVGAVSCKKEQEDPLRVLVFSKTAEFRHTSIEAGKAALLALGQQHNFLVDTTEDAANFYEENLQRYSAVIFLNTTGDVLDKAQQNDFERYIQAGGGYVGIHAATDTEYAWPWYGKLSGARFVSHPNDPNVQQGTFVVVEKDHPSTSTLPERWEREDEFYNFKEINPDIKTLITIDESTYQGGTNGDNHPMAWYHEYDGGRAFYTNMGHTDESFAEPLFLEHLWGGIQYAMGGDSRQPLDYSKAKSPRVPEENRFTKIVLAEQLDEPMELAVLDRGRVLFIERKGKVKLYDPAAGQLKTIATLAVSTKYTNQQGKQTEAEDGLLGVAADPNFEQNGWIYLYYSPAGSEPKNILTRYELKGDELVLDSRKVLLEVAVQREECCHTGGSIAFDAQGNLYLSTGDNTNPHATGYAPIDERPGRSHWDAQKGSANTNDLRGKILRIHPEADGSYTIPEGNLFAGGTTKTRPEIYTMGHRNPFRISVDKQTGFVYWGDVGPDAGKDSVAVGPRGHDEFNQARKAGNFGWPHFIGNNKAYGDVNFAAATVGKPFEPQKPINNSPNNTGLQELPPAQPAYIWYPYATSEEFPLVGDGGRTAMAGPVFRKEDFNNAPRPFPDYYEGKWFIYEWMRGWIMAVSMDKQGNFVEMEPFMPNAELSNPMDMEFGPEGDLYMLEYGQGWFQGNPDARLVRIEYNAGNRKPVIQLAADKKAGSVPLTVNFSAEGTSDPDRDALTYEWKVTPAGGKAQVFSKDPNPAFTFDKPGNYTVSLQVSDEAGGSVTHNLEVLAGNEPPRISFDIEGNRTFFFPGQPIRYVVTVNDKEDGSLAAGQIPAEEVALTIDYLKEGFDKIAIAQGHRNADASVAFAQGKKLMEDSDCKACHALNKKSIGPSYQQVAQKYKGDANAVDYLAGKIINGGSGVWGEAVMSAHPQLPVEDAKEIVRYILNTGTEKNQPSLPLQGSYVAKVPAHSGNQGVFIARAAYTDKGAQGVPPVKAEEVLVLRHPFIAPATADMAEGIQKYKLEEPPIELVIAQKNSSYIAFRQLDLSGIAQLEIAAEAPIEYLNAAGGFIEVRVGSPTGTLIGQSTEIKPGNMSADRRSPKLKVDLKPTAGLQDVYFVFKNSNPANEQTLFVLSGIEFKPVVPQPRS